MKVLVKWKQTKHETTLKQHCNNVCIIRTNAIWKYWILLESQIFFSTKADHDQNDQLQNHWPVKQFTAYKTSSFTAQIHSENNRRILFNETTSNRIVYPVITQKTQCQREHIASLSNEKKRRKIYTLKFLKTPIDTYSDLGKKK